VVIQAVSGSHMILDLCKVLLADTLYPPFLLVEDSYFVKYYLDCMKRRLS
jgi:hypothetical protein